MKMTIRQLRGIVREVMESSKQEFGSKEEFDTALAYARKRAAEAHHTADMSDDHGAWVREKAAARELDTKVEELEKQGMEKGWYTPPKAIAPRKLSPLEMEFAVGSAGRWLRLMEHNPDKAEEMAAAWEPVVEKASLWNTGKLRGEGIEQIVDRLADDLGLKRWDIHSIINSLFTKDRGSRVTAKDLLDAMKK